MKNAAGKNQEMKNCLSTKLDEAHPELYRKENCRPAVIIEYAKYLMPLEESK
jgi:hypothetical protein